MADADGKICPKCNKYTINYGVNKASKTGRAYVCKLCVNANARLYNRTAKGVITSIYGSQRTRSKRRGHDMPDYTKDELQTWLYSDNEFSRLYEEWVNSGYISMLKPSCDRTDDSMGYSLSRLSVVTWGVNKANGHTSMRDGNIMVTSNPQKSVAQYDLGMDFIKEFVSAHQAYRELGIWQQNISKVCNGKLETAGGFIWKFI